MTEKEIVSPASSNASWSPKAGDATDSLGKFLVDAGELPDVPTFDNIVGSSLEIIANCREFSGPDGQRTGLVVGYVQSGKTISMTTVASLARDNGCRLVILLAGITSNLLKQTARERLLPYLQDRPDPRRAWRFRDSVEGAKIDNLRQEIRNWTGFWKRQDVPEDRKRPLFITVMKNHKHLEHLSKQLENLNLSGVPALIIDDEADQASLDTSAGKKPKKKSGAEVETVRPSTTYQKIRELRDCLPHHTYLQYTATPQAPLLISLADMLSPEFSSVLSPGGGYTGGKAFFRDGRRLVHEIPEDELFPPDSPPDEPPPSLSRAVRLFLVGASVGSLGGAEGKRSMLIHPSQRRSDHDAFLEFVEHVKANWLSELRLPKEDSSRAACIEDFRGAYDDLKTTADDLPPFEEVIKELDRFGVDLSYCG